MTINSNNFFDNFSDKENKYLRLNYQLMANKLNEKKSFDRK